jgi:type II secretory pathway pseudopilin PulG
MRPERTIPRRREHGYAMLVLLLMVATLAIAAAVVAPSITFQIKRDREEELIHRGVQYSRAIRHYVKKFGRYPTQLEQLENTNNIHFLRKRYKDPITGGEFKLLHLGEVQLQLGTTPAVGTPAADLNKKPADDSSKKADSTDSDTEKSGGDSDKSGGDQLSKQVFGGGPIVGVVSTSKKETIREFNHKNHYNEWQFIYDPATDRGGLLTTPAQPVLNGANPVTPQQGATLPTTGTANSPKPTEPAPQGTDNPDQ